jgi:hypothetical protein
MAAFEEFVHVEHSSALSFEQSAGKLCCVNAVRTRAGQRRWPVRRCTSPPTPASQLERNFSWVGATLTYDATESQRLDPRPLSCASTREHATPFGSLIVRPLWRTRATSSSGDHGEGFRMPFGVRKPPKHEPAGLRQGLWGFRLLPNAIMAASGRRSCRGGCGERDFSPGGRWHRSLPVAMFSPSVKVLAKGAWMAVAGTTGVAAWGEGFPCRVMTASRSLCEPGAVRAAASSARTSR